MFCCSNCFADSEIQAIINGNKIYGNCNFCGKQDVYVYELGKDDILTDLFDGLLDIYTPITSLPIDFPKDHTDLLKNILYCNWHIFNIEPDYIYRLITNICSDRYKEQPELFDSPIGILQSQDYKYLEENAILKTHCWNDFVEAIKHKNRFHNDFINTEVLYTFLRCARKSYKAGKVFYRSRTCPTEKGYTCKEVGAPPYEKAKAGRVNPDGISILYLADSKETTLYEIRAGVYDYVTVGTFKLQKDIEVVNLAEIDKISPFIGINYDFDFTQYAINIEHLKMIGQEIAKPLRNDNVLDYLPTQYISDYIKSKDYDGIEYISTMCKKGVNLAVFNQNLLKCNKTEIYDVKSISYSYEKIK